ncbi:hypothetical protein T440DRAFT_473299, partial [Plenodomus tracheiphilus IPT5]
MPKLMSAAYLPFMRASGVCSLPKPSLHQDSRYTKNSCAYDIPHRDRDTASITAGAHSYTPLARRLFSFMLSM